jgi:hypothetical protein
LRRGCERHGPQAQLPAPRPQRYTPWHEVMTDPPTGLGACCAVDCGVIHL